MDYGGVYSNLADLKTFMEALLIKKNLLKPPSLNIMLSIGAKPDGSNRYGYGIQRKFIEREPHAGWGHAGRDLGYTANLFYFPTKNTAHIFLINYGTDAKSRLRDVFYDFQNELLDITLK
ncbi:MAG: serine hydrolase [Bacteroidia bacterium]|nr:serine hydrolase [Bacteroidia bacterium]